MTGEQEIAFEEVCDSFLLGKTVRIQNVGSYWNGKLGKLINHIHGDWYTCRVGKSIGIHPSRRKDLILDQSKSEFVLVANTEECVEKIKVVGLKRKSFLAEYQSRSKSFFGEIVGEWNGYPVDWDFLTTKKQNIWLRNLCVDNGMPRDGRIIRIVVSS